jgi:type IX secretion system PorP/SprF family membrane protein
VKANKIRIVFTGLIMLHLASLNAQQFPLYSQYWANKFILNPAIAGHEGYTSFNLTARKQWAGMDQAPSTVAISGQTRFVKNSHISRGRPVHRKKRHGMSRGAKVGYGGYIFSDNLGAINKTGFQGTYSYNMAMRKSALSFGFSLVGLQYNINQEKIITQEEDEFIKNLADNRYFIDANFGSYYSDKNLYAGFSVQNLFESFIKLNHRDEGSKLTLERQYLLMSGYRIDLLDYIYLEPSFLFKFSENVVSQLDLNLSCYFKENYWAGLAYRTGSGSSVSSETLDGKGSSLIIYGGARIDKFFVGYSFDYTFSSIQAHTYGSHEIMLAVRFGDNARRYRWLNRY